jgi:hypothetical protein
MQGQSRAVIDARRRRALAILVICVLGLALVTAARSAQAHKHVSRGVAVVTVSGADTPHSHLRSDQSGVVAAAPAVNSTFVSWGASADSSTRVSSRTAQAPQVRGPPGQALA